MENKAFGLLGKNISYSFSKKYFEEKFKKLFLKNHSYNFIDIPEIDLFKSVTENPDLVGINVTIPYKQAVIPFLDELSDEALQIGAVNCVRFQNGKKIGYNTDAFGFEKTLLINKKEHHKKALILGDGGAAKAVRYILDKHNIEHQTVSRKSEINFENLSEDLVKDSLLIIQTTPVGTFPNVDDSIKFPFDAITDKHYVIDLIYNPSETAFLRKSAEKGATTLNGFYMLEQQAEKAWEIWKS
ncbi:shikimate dehydrogenase family protein [Chryseobacterium sp. FH1]|uniref:shikimate dehydrogenase family protein n=1 Tax=Chryseobacterium sp. FH1 TaxID=1233951 RepID=UPI0004E3C4EA|nr:shikimate dehydrogenase [Chryseobacterium sp. FH1]KFC20535.1 shikimate dehydrogenase [Chryseobacterium sp. FH1]